MWERVSRLEPPTAQHDEGVAEAAARLVAAAPSLAPVRPGADAPSRPRCTPMAPQEADDEWRQAWAAATGGPLPTTPCPDPLPFPRARHVTPGARLRRRRGDAGRRARVRRRQLRRVLQPAARRHGGLPALPPRAAELRRTWRAAGAGGAAHARARVQRAARAPEQADPTHCVQHVRRLLRARPRLLLGPRPRHVHRQRATASLRRLRRQALPQRQRGGEATPPHRAHEPAEAAAEGAGLIGRAVRVLIVWCLIPVTLTGTIVLCTRCAIHISYLCLLFLSNMSVLPSAARVCSVWQPRQPGHLREQATRR